MDYSFSPSKNISFVGGTEGFLKCTIFVFSKFTFNALCLHHVLRISNSNCKSFSFSVISYGAAILGTRDFSCINAVQHRGIRFFMGLSKYPPNDAINGNMGWKPPCAKQWSCVLRHWASVSTWNDLT
jgi:hypothetical protein